MLTLKDLPIGKTATVKTVGGDGSLRQHLLDMGIIPEADVTMVKYAPMGDPVELRIHSYELTLRLADAERIEIENIRDTKVEKHTLLPRNDKEEYSSSRTWGGRKVPYKGNRKSTSRWYSIDFCTSRKSELWKNYTF